MFQGVLIKETITDESLFDHIEIEKVEICKTNEAIRYWTLVFFKSDTADFPKMVSQVIIDGWFADMKKGNTKYIIFKNAVLSYEIGNAEEKEAVLNECRERGIPDEQFGWSE